MANLLAEKYQKKITEIKENVAAWQTFFKENNRRFHEFRRLVYVSSLIAQDEGKMELLKTPKIEFNILLAFVSRLIGEFFKYDPDVNVSSNGIQQVNPAVIGVIEGHMRYIMQDNTDNGWKKQIYQDCLCGGFSVAKVYTEYENPMSFKQRIMLKRVYEPTMCGFDPLAETPHKGDGRFCYEYIIMREDEFKSKYDIDISSLSYTKSSNDFSWSFTGGNGKKYVVLLDYYEVKKKKIKIVELADGTVLEKDKYDKMLTGEIEQEQFQPSPIVAPLKDERSTEIDRICRYRTIEDKVIDFKKTDYTFLPLVFFDGDSIKIKKENTEDVTDELKQFTKPYVYAAKGMQMLKNIAGQTLVKEMENMSQLKFKVALESIPEQYLKAYQNPQIPSNLIYHGFKVGKDGIDVPLPPPQEIPRVPVPQEVVVAFAEADKSIQNILGSYDASLGINDNQLSGVAIVEGATQSNSAAMPYIENFLLSLNRIGHIILDLIPKYIVKPTSLPVIDKQGKTQSQEVNGESMQLGYSPFALNIKVKAGASFAIQKSKALQQITLLMQASPLFAQFINQNGLPILLDNLDIRGSDLLKAEAEKFMQEMKQQPPAPDPKMLKVQLERQRLQHDIEQSQVDSKLKAAELSINKQSSDNERAKLHAEMTDQAYKRIMQHEAHETAKGDTALKVAVQAADIMHKHAKETKK